ncbi:Uncharacterized protein SCF082_LOCUS46949 [Durusdinium trenchii]|uniref:Uncharacterized protein n=1 Tax=Durusdinium trenchii TaxID=1381693 RepID=A0ABP0RI76_9DINO
MAGEYKDATFAAVAEILGAFAELGTPFEASVDFWLSVTAKVPGNSIRHLAPMLRALRDLKVLEPALLEAVAQELLLRLEDALQPDMTTPEVTPDRPRPAPFPAPPRLPQLLGNQVEGAAKDVAGQAEESQALVTTDPNALFQVEADDAIIDEDEDSDGKAEGSTGRTRRWYNAVTRKLDLSADPDASQVPFYAPFNADDAYRRNLRGFRVAQALEGLEALRAVSAASGQATSGGGESSDSPQPLDLRLLDAAQPLVASALQGLTPAQLTVAAELYAGSEVPSNTDLATVKAILRESLRRMSNFSLDEIRRLNAACESCGAEDPYLSRAQKRRFPKALRKELRIQTA